MLVGTAQNPVAYVRVKGSRKLVPSFTLSEGDRQFSIDNAELYLLAIVYAIDLNNETYKIKLHQGAIKMDSFVMVPLQWQALYQLNFEEN